MDARDEDGSTRLHLASRSGHAELAGMFLERAAEVTVQDKDGLTPLYLASRWGLVEVTRMLLERAADVNVQEEDGPTLLHPASSADTRKSSARFSYTAPACPRKTPSGSRHRPGVPKRKRGRRSDPAPARGGRAARLGDGCSTSGAAVGPCTVACVLLEHGGADAMTRDGDELTPFDLAAREGGCSCVA